MPALWPGDKNRLEITDRYDKKASTNRGLSFFCTQDGSRTRTDITIHRILSPACLPIPPPGQVYCLLINDNCLTGAPNPDPLIHLSSSLDFTVLLDADIIYNISCAS